MPFRRKDDKDKKNIPSSRDSSRGKELSGNIDDFSGCRSPKKKCSH